MADPNKSKALYSSGVAFLGFACFALAATAIGLPLWGYFENPTGDILASGIDRGHFGPWQLCKQSYLGKTKCGDSISRFHPDETVRIAGYFALFGTFSLAVFCVLSIIQLAMIVSREKVVIAYSKTIISKLVFAFAATLLSIIAAGLFALQTDDRNITYQVTRGESFYMQICLIILNFLLFVAAIYDLIFSRRMGGDPTISYRDPTGVEATTFNNPSFKEKRSINPRGPISVTDASGKPYLSGGVTNGGSTMSMTTTLSSNGSTILGSPAVRSPLRSSLKKPKATNGNGFGIQNPGFSGTSPTLSRNGSVKKVRIQTQSTAV
ncbi:uncharacterized protein LOC126897482 [Daktulosphaira vitifoliae]|uniref:uncharacterized protein LOC126897482 n=1 Tax=Daktulosphaira vitifoliae TaxID=58002 RepID=UPI0021AB02E7|nr:uncharacterized protein LOC126897482 [Daktulosphaira vitifoliae]XP_050527077.1 uncharacterized protein LOC126897482 [Daktulosphaira vitifoliae]XP_050527078.1 uncharacterized protein LOC126897482 [Daktulosphaira vitifoliae]XP_050527079.1 uncharacterized protein LOC126897482 [Daktulosphaira vitifoliae]XP_050527081.1 uncharacterized protein LOC126897482 [Daktulosphaira vitifoliae]